MSKENPRPCFRLMSSRPMSWPGDDLAAGVWPGVDYCVLWPLASRGEIITNIGFIADTRGVAAEGCVKRLD